MTTEDLCYVGETLSGEVSRERRRSEVQQQLHMWHVGRGGGDHIELGFTENALERVGRAHRRRSDDQPDRYRQWIIEVQHEAIGHRVQRYDPIGASETRLRLLQKLGAVFHWF
jgi:hypothetical protein